MQLTFNLDEKQERLYNTISLFIQDKSKIELVRLMKRQGINIEFTSSIDDIIHLSYTLLIILHHFHNHEDDGTIKSGERL